MSITDHIEASGLSRGQICERAGVSRSMLSLMESGKRQIRADRAKALAEVLGVAVADIRPDLAKVFDATSNERGAA